MAQAFQEISTNPANIAKYQNNPKVQEIIKKLSKKFGGPAPGKYQDQFCILHFSLDYNVKLP